MQGDILQRLEAGRVDLRDLPAELPFGQLLQSTYKGFFPDPRHGGNRSLMGWKLVGFSGVHADFMDWANRGEEYPFPPMTTSGKRG